MIYMQPTNESSVNQNHVTFSPTLRFTVKYLTHGLETGGIIFAVSEADISAPTV